MVFMFKLLSILNFVFHFTVKQKYPLNIYEYLHVLWLILYQWTNQEPSPFWSVWPRQTKVNTKQISLAEVCALQTSYESLGWDAAAWAGVDCNLNEGGCCKQGQPKLHSDTLSPRVGDRAQCWSDCLVYRLPWVAPQNYTADPEPKKTTKKTKETPKPANPNHWFIVTSKWHVQRPKVEPAMGSCSQSHLYEVTLRGDLSSPHFASAELRTECVCVRLPAG